MYQFFSPNLQGKDYICSDVHGYFYILEAELERLGFDVSCDRLFSLGDLIDRGHESHLVLDWLQKPWFFAIQGNHERMLINALDQESETLRHQWMMWGGRWAENLSRAELEPFYMAFRNLPIAIELALPNNTSVGLVHAELPSHCDWNAVKQELQSLTADKVESVLSVSDMLWNRTQPYLPPEKWSQVERVRNIEHVFHGHSIVDDYLTIANRTFMDLGAYQTGNLGLIAPLEFLAKQS